MRLDDAQEYSPAYRAQVERRPVMLVGPYPGVPHLIGLWMRGPDGTTMQNAEGAPALTCHRSTFDAAAGDPRAMLLDLARTVLDDPDTENVAVLLAEEDPC